MNLEEADQTRTETGRFEKAETATPETQSTPHDEGVPRSREAGLPIACIGASTGGLEALEFFLEESAGRQRPPGCRCFARDAERLHEMKDRFTLPALFLIFVILAAGIVTAGCLYYGRQQDKYRTEVEHKLATSRN